MPWTGLARSGGGKQRVDASIEAQKMHPELAHLLHTENLKIPEGTQLLNLRGKAYVPLPQACEVARLAMHVQSVLPKAVARFKVSHKLSGKLNSTMRS